MRGGRKNTVSKKNIRMLPLCFSIVKVKHPDNYSGADPMKGASRDPAS